MSKKPIELKKPEAERLFAARLLELQEMAKRLVKRREAGFGYRQVWIAKLRIKAHERRAHWTTVQVRRGKSP